MKRTQSGAGERVFNLKSFSPSERALAVVTASRSPHRLVSTRGIDKQRSAVHRESRRARDRNIFHRVSAARWNNGIRVPVAVYPGSPSALRLPIRRAALFARLARSSLSFPLTISGVPLRSKQPHARVRVCCLPPLTRGTRGIP